MILSIQSEFNVFMLVLIVGVLLGFIYDIFRALRRVYKHKNSVVNIEDFAYWIFTILILFEFLKYKNSGEFRGFILIGCVIGSTLYFYLASEVVLEIETKILKFINLSVMKIMEIIKNIFSKIYLLLSKMKVLYKENQEPRKPED